MGAVFASRDETCTFVETGLLISILLFICCFRSAVLGCEMTR